MDSSTTTTTTTTQQPNDSINMLDDNDQDGGHIKGNFKNYYTFHPVQDRQDLIQLAMSNIITKLPSSTGNTFSYLDIGCNEGDLSLHVHDMLTNVLAGYSINTIGIDIDEELIHRAQVKSSTTKLSLDAKQHFIQFIKCDAELFLSRSQIINKSAPTTTRRRKFHLISLFSVTMWIHLNHGDQGLANVLSAIAKQSYNILIEPQPWSAYTRAKKRLNKRKNLGNKEHYCYYWQDDQLECTGERLIPFLYSFFPSDEFIKIDLGINSWGREMILFMAKES
jgi:hypothetical protein